MSIKQKIKGKVSLVPINASEIKLSDVNGNFKNKNVESALKELKEDNYIKYEKNNITTLNINIKRGQYSVQDGDSTFPWNFGTLLILEKYKEKTAIFQGTGGITGTFVSYLVDGKDSWTEWQRLVSSDEVSNPNLLINGDFQICQKGKNFQNIINSIPLDGWIVATDGKGTANVDKTEYGMKVSVNGTPAFVNILQVIEKELIKKNDGKYFTLTFKTKEKTDTISQIWCMRRSNPVKYYWNRGFNDGVLRDTFTMTFIINDPTENVEFGIQMKGTNGSSIEIEWAKAEVSMTPTKFVPRTYSEEMLMCKRYYRVERLNCFPIGGGFGEVTNNIGIYHTFNPPMRIAPTVTLAGNNLFEICSIQDIESHISSVNSYSDFLGNIVLKETKVKQGLVYSGIFIMNSEL